MDPLVTGEQLEAYLSAPVVLDTMDDDNNGTIDTAVSDQARLHGTARFYATVRGIYETPFVAPIDPFAVEVVLQIIHCYLVRRVPERFRRGLKVCEEVDALLKEIRAGNLQFEHPLRTGGMTPECFSEEPRGYNSLEPSSDDD